MSIDKHVLQVSYLIMEAAIYPSGWHFKTAQTKTKAIPTTHMAENNFRGTLKNTSANTCTGTWVLSQNGL